MKLALIEHWPIVAWHSATSWVATVLGFLVGALSGTYGAAFAVIAFLPEYVQLPLAGIVGAIVIGGPVILARITAQPAMTAKIASKEGG